LSIWRRRVWTVVVTATVARLRPPSRHDAHWFEPKAAMWGSIGRAQSTHVGCEIALIPKTPAARLIGRSSACLDER